MSNENDHLAFTMDHNAKLREMGAKGRRIVELEKEVEALQRQLSILNGAVKLDVRIPLSFDPQRPWVGVGRVTCLHICRGGNGTPAIIYIIPTEGGGHEV